MSVVVNTAAQSMEGKKNKQGSKKKKKKKKAQINVCRCVAMNGLTEVEK